MKNTSQKKEKVLSTLPGYQMVAVFEALERAGAGTDFFNEIKRNPKFCSHVVSVGRNFLRDRFLNEEVDSAYTYPDGFLQKKIKVQIQILANYFNVSPEKALAYSEKTLEHTDLRAEGLFATLRWELLSNDYAEAVEILLDLISKKRSFFNYRAGEINELQLRQNSSSRKMMKKASRGQKGDIIIIPAQLGKRYRGISSQRAEVLFDNDEFALGVFFMGCVMLTHPDLEKNHKDQLHPFCAGDEFDLVRSGQFNYVPTYVSSSSDSGELHLDFYSKSEPLERYGIPTGFVI